MARISISNTDYDCTQDLLSGELLIDGETTGAIVTQYVTSLAGVDDDGQQHDGYLPSAIIDQLAEIGDGVDPQILIDDALAEVEELITARASADVEVCIGRHPTADLPIMETRTIEIDQTEYMTAAGAIDARVEAQARLDDEIRLAEAISDVHRAPTLPELCDALNRAEAALLDDDQLCDRINLASLRTYRYDDQDLNEGGVYSWDDDSLLRCDGVHWYCEDR